MQNFMFKNKGGHYWAHKTERINSFEHVVELFQRDGLPKSKAIT